MKSVLKSMAQALLGFAATCGVAFADPCGAPPLDPCAVPEPGSLPLLLLAIGGAVVVARFLGKKK